MENNEEIKIVFNIDAKQSNAIFNNEIIGECEFEINNSIWYITHTGVRPEFGGRGIAKLLVKSIIEEARKRNTKIVPICSYAQKMMLNNEEYSDILAKR